MTLELANGKNNKFFTLKSEGENRYFIADFDEEQTKGLNNVYLLAKEVKEKSVVLDIGCGQGRFGKVLKKRECTVYGIDYDQNAIEYAKNSGYYNDVFIMDITDDNYDERSTINKLVNQVDVILMSDILEHVPDPTKILLKYSRFLKEEGIFLISVPNVAHIDILLNLMNDKFNYQDIGILDNTHLKFFTKSSFIDWINQINEKYNDINLDCEYLGATFYNNEFLNRIKKDYNELFTILENCLNYNGLQILFKITKLSQDQVPLKLKILKEEEETDIVEILGNSLKGKINNVQNHRLVEGERLWYEQKIKYLQIEIEEKDNYINELEKNVQWHADKVQELNKALDWHSENEKTTKTNMEKKDNYIKELEENLQWHGDKLKELNKALEWYSENEKNIQTNIIEKDNYINELEKNVQWHADKVQELNKALDWHSENEKITKTNMEKKDNYIKELEENLQWHGDKLKELNKALDWHSENVKSTKTNMEEKYNYIKELEENLQMHAGKVQELNKALEWHIKNEKYTQTIAEKKDKYISDLEENLNLHVNKIQELNKALEWYSQNEKDLEMHIKEQEVLFEENNIKLKQEILELRKRIFFMESTRSWRWTKFLRR
jgi:O-antigen biosynthesis protein